MVMMDELCFLWYCLMNWVMGCVKDWYGDLMIMSGIGIRWLV